MIYVIYFMMALISFLIMLNGFLRGAKKAQIDACLGVLIVCLTIISFYVGGWDAGLIGIGVASLSALIARPLAARVASKLFALDGLESGDFPGLPNRTLKRISEELGRPFDPNQIMKHSDSRRDALEALLDYCTTSLDVRQVMDEYDIWKDDLQQLYSDLIDVGAGQWRCGHWVAASALAYPETLRYIIDERNKKKVLEETAWNLLMYFERGTPLSE